LLDNIFNKLKSPINNTNTPNEETKVAEPTKTTVSPNKIEVLEFNWGEDNIKLDDEYLLDDKIEETKKSK